MTQTPLDDLPYVVTVCNVGNAHIGLLFANRYNLHAPTPEAEISRMMISEDLDQTFGRSFCGVTVSWVPSQRYRWDRSNEQKQYGLLVGTENFFFRKAEELGDAVLYLRHGAVLARLPAQTAYDACIRMVKLMGCARCNVEAHECVPLNMPDALRVVTIKDESYLDPNQLTLPCTTFERTLPDHVSKRVFGDRYWERLSERGLDYDDWKGLGRTNWKTSVAGAQLVSPLATARNTPAPNVPSIRPLIEHDFEGLEERREILSERSRAGATTRSHIRKECTHCYFGWKSSYGRKTIHPCSMWRARDCEHGAWTEERLITYTFERFERALEGTPFTLNALWRVANLAGIKFKKRHAHTRRPREWVLSRIHKPTYLNQGPALHIIVARTSRSARGDTLELDHPQKVREFLSPKLRALWDDMKDLEPQDHGHFALWLHLAITSQGQSYNTSYSTESSVGFSQVQPRVGWVSLRPRYASGVERYLWLSRKERSTSFDSFNELQSRYGDLLLFKMRELEDEAVPSLYTYVR